MSAAGPLLRVDRRLLVCLVTSRRQLTPDARTTNDEVVALERWLDEAIGRVDLIQIRERDLDVRVLHALVRGVAGRARGGTTTVVVNDRADIARAAGAGGVHARVSGPSIARVRPLGPPGWVLGRSVHSVEEVLAEPAADYLVFGTVFPSGSKGAAVPGQGIGALAAAVRATRLPVLAIGGVDPRRAAECREAGAAGVAAIGLFLPPGRAVGALGITRAEEALRELRPEK